MNFIGYFYIKTFKYDLINKFFYHNTKKLPKLKKIILNFGCKTAEIKQLSASLLALELITNQKGLITITKKSNVLLKIRKGNPTGCKITLKKSNMLNFLSKILIEIFPRLKNFNGFNFQKKIKKNMFSYELHNTFSFSGLEKQYYLFNNIPKLDITLVTNSEILDELIFILKSIQFPIKN